MTRGGAYFESSAAGAGRIDLLVIRVNTLFHLEPHGAVCRHLIHCQAPHTGCRFLNRSPNLIQNASITAAEHSSRVDAGGKLPDPFFSSAPQVLHVAIPTP